MSFEKSKKTFLGFLQARGKALNTIKNYACDLTEFGRFCEEKKLGFRKLGVAELEAYHGALKQRGLRPNSRRRKLMTVRTFLRYLSGRTDVSTIGSERMVPPEKIEKAPRLVSREFVSQLIAAQPDSAMGVRNRALLGVLVETGMLVTEAVSLRRQDCTFEKNGATLQITGKRARVIRVSTETAAALRELAQRVDRERYFFYGYTRSGPNAERLTPRGVEVLFKIFSKSSGAKHFHPRTLRHIFVIESLLQGKSEAEVMQALALRTPYAFRVYRPMVDELRARV